jgi:hypothetical protein
MSGPGHDLSTDLMAGRVWHAGASGNAGTMTDSLARGSDAAAGTYRCTHCGYELAIENPQP